MRRRSILPAAGGPCIPLLAAMLALGCGHTEPFSNPDNATDTPLDAGPPARLTYNTAADRGPAWVADGSAIVYSAQPAGRPDGDVCLAVLPPTGGTQRELWCDVPDGADRRDAIESAAPAPGGGIAFLSATGATAGTNPSREGIVLAPTLDPRGAEMVRTFPYTPDGGVPESSGEQLRWLGETRLVYIGGQFRTRQLCSGCDVDTLRIGQGVTVLETAAPGSTPAALPGTAMATGVAAGPNPDLVYYTLGGDTRVYRRTLSTGAVEIAHDFGPAGIVRDISLAGDRLAAVVGGRVAFVLDPLFGQVQWDSGGEIHVVNLATGEDSFLDPAGLLFRRPAIAPEGNAVVAEGYPLILSRVPDQPGVVDTTVAKAGDLYLYGGS